MTIVFKDYKKGDPITTVKVRDGLPIGATGVVHGNNSHEVVIKLDKPWDTHFGRYWYMYHNEVSPLINLDIPLLGDDDEDCI